MSGTTRPLDAPALEALLAELAVQARQFRFEVAPNPTVGAAVLRGGEVIARGYHQRWGGHHAEIEALKAARESGVPPEEWSQLVVTLEPCHSTGKTPPCTEAVLGSGIREVVVGALDPDPRHRGAGLRALEEAGLEVRVSSLSLEEHNASFLRWLEFERVRRPRPWMIAKWAQTLTGQLLPPEHIGEGRWISGEGSRAEVGVLRGHVDAILTGIGTVIADDPRLTVRPPIEGRPAPARVVVDTALRTPPDARLFEEVDRVPVHLLSARGGDPTGARGFALVEAGAQVHGLRADGPHRLNAREVTHWLWEQGFRRVLLEAGPSLLGTFLDAGFVDQVRVYTGGVPGGRGESMGAWLGASSLEERLDREVGEDQVLEAFRSE